MSPPDSNYHQGNEPSESSANGAKAVEYLGEALAGINIGNNNSSSSGFGVGSSAIATTGGAFAITPGSGTLRDSSNSNSGISSGHNGATGNDGWGSFVTLASEGENSNGVASSVAGAAAASSTIDNSAHRRHESLDLFLSQSPSQTLGEDVFKFSHSNLPALAEDEQLHSGIPESLNAPTAASTSFSDIHRPYQESVSRRRVDSPTCSVTGTTTSSRSVSPYGNSDVTNSRSIHAYQNHRFDGSAPSPFSESTASIKPKSRGLSNLDLSRRSPYGKDRNRQFNQTNLSGNTYEDHGNYDPNRMSANSGRNQLLDQLPNQQATLQHNGGVAGGQVLYMAVPSPDGRGQVLQPVQMMQLPGKQFTYVVPNAGTTGGIPSVTAVMPQHSQQHQHAVAMMPTTQGNNGTNNLSEYGLSNRNGRFSSDSINSSSYAIDNYDMPLGSYSDNSGLTKGSIDAGQFSSDPALASLYASSQRPPLESLLGQIRRLSRDQVGCRLVQQALDEEGPMGATLILQEGLPFWGEAMVDPFGNYLFQKILEKVTPEERIMLIQSVSSRIVNASLNLHGTRSVQKVVELCAQDEQEGRVIGVEESAAVVLTKALAPSAARLCIDSHGNHVIQRILLRLGPLHSQFVFDAVASSVSDVARHRHGCCVIQRCLDSPHSPSRAHLVRRIVQKSLELMQDAYGNYVVQYVLDVCSDDDVHAVCDSIVGKANLLAIQKFSSNVMEKCLERCTDRTKELYLAEMSDPERVRELMMDPFGNYVIQRALSVATHSQAIRLVEAMRPHLMAVPMTGPNGARNGGVRNTAGGRRIIAKICRRFPNFTLNPMGTQEELYSQNKGNHRYLNHHQQNGLMQPQHVQQAQHQSLMATYAPVGAPLQYYTPADPGMAPMSHMTSQAQQQQYQYGLGGSTAGYYNPFGDSHGAYPGM